MIVRQAANVLEILEYFARVGQPATLADISEHFGWPRSSTFNLLTTLSEKGYLYEPRPRSGYYPTPRWLVLAKAISDAEPLASWTHELLADICAETGETTAIAAPSGTLAVFVDVIESNEAIRYFAQVGHRVPIHASSSGRALLLQYAVEERNKLYRKVEFRQYSKTSPLSIEAVETELRKSEERGYCISHAEFSRDLTGIAFPLAIGERRLSIVVAGPSFRMDPKVVEVSMTIAKTIKRLQPLI
jgi:IclR family transcriptional regulator, acetate operon repressor